MTSKADLEKVIRKRIEKLSPEEKETAIQKAYEKAKPSQTSKNTPETDLNIDEGVSSEEQVKEAEKTDKKLRRAKEKKMNGYINKGGKGRG